MQVATLARRPTFEKAAVRATILVAIGVLSGWGAWGRELEWVAFALLMPIAWTLAPGRFAAYGVALGYYLGAARGIPHGAAVFFGPAAPAYSGEAMWLGASLLLAAPWAFAWSARMASLWWRLPLAALASTAPPLGIIGWASPFAGAGLWFPGSGWIGLGLAFTAVVAVAVRPLFIPLVAIVVAVFNVAHAHPAPPAGWAGVNTEFGGNGSVARDFIREYTRHQALIAKARETPPASVVVFPELMGGLWMRPAEDLWADTVARLSDVGSTVLIGAELPIAGSRKLDNVVLVRGAAKATFYQRIPVPVSMYRPFSDTGYRAELFGTGVEQIGHQRVAMLICYEQVLLWPALLSMLARPTVLVGVANDYWAKDTSIPAIQAANMQAIGRLFGVPVVSAVNF